MLRSGSTKDLLQCAKEAVASLEHCEALRTGRRLSMQVWELLWLPRGLSLSLLRVLLSQNIEWSASNA